MYETLELSKDATAAEIKMAYFKLAKQYHPDVNKEKGAKEKYVEINEAYQTLSDESKRRVYDSTGMSSNEQ